MISIILHALLIFALRFTDVSLGTMRMIFIIQGRRLVAAVVGFVEVSIFLIAISIALSKIDNIISIFAYASGFACGTLMGITIEHRLALGWSHVRIISNQKSEDIWLALREAGFGVTVVDGEGLKGPIKLIYTVVRRKFTREIIKIAESIDKNAFITLHDSRHIYRGYLGYNKKK